MPAINPDAEQRSTGPQGRHKPIRANRAFEWRRCPRHPWLGVSILIVGDTARCILPDGSDHPAEVAA